MMRTTYSACELETSALTRSASLPFTSVTRAGDGDEADPTPPGDEKLKAEAPPCCNNK